MPESADPPVAEPSGDPPDAGGVGASIGGGSAAGGSDDGTVSGVSGAGIASVPFDVGGATTDWEAWATAFGGFAPAVARATPAASNRRECFVIVNLLC
jgi:hypothetical protein